MIKLCSPNGFLEMHVLLDDVGRSVANNNHLVAHNNLLKYTTITTYYKALNDEATATDHIEA
ncbi:hypothetical protein T4B_11755 [Trichinella pseudospiralis]|uniref:Uncharacterized protein n=2 Tax=Trichinella pseudospiralis TaxID=6337 RepID=A0A0V1FDA8_TRIPS|nr:hypothetical protein T4D_7614 [Trichinella pseudospiralis]KRZ26488.1 hypothetical protein T4B_11755 [Trichinella pseudospiralis]KRZ33238.1 hypothetical protein T4C_6072 [Trichinella pseudospiralis]